MIIGIAGKPFSKIQIAIGILQFCVYWGFLRYIWAFAWSLFIIWKGITSSQPGSQQAQVHENNSGYNMKNLGNISNPYDDNVPPI